MRQDSQARQSLPTVGDTLSIVHRVYAPGDALVQPRAPMDSMLATLLGVPEVTREGDSVRIAYTLSVWQPGRNELVIPGAIVLSTNGAVDTLPDSRVQLDVASLLPLDVTVESLPPKAARPWVPRTEVSWLPMLVLLLPVLVLLGLAAWGWRRRGPLVVVPEPVRVEDPLPRLRGWLELGEVELVIEHLGHLLPDDDAAVEWRARVAAVRFKPDSSDALADLAAEGLTRLAVQAPA